MKRCPKKTPKDLKNSKKKMKDAKDDLEKARDRYRKLLQQAQEVKQRLAALDPLEKSREEEFKKKWVTFKEFEKKHALVRICQNHL